MKSYCVKDKVKFYSIDIAQGGLHVFRSYIKFLSQIKLTLNRILKLRGETYANIICHISIAIQNG